MRKEARGSQENPYFKNEVKLKEKMCNLVAASKNRDFI